VTGPLCGEVPLAVKFTPLGALSLTSSAAAGVSVVARGAQLASPTCGSVVEVLVDELLRGGLAIALPALGGWSTYVVAGLRDVAESWRGELGDDLLNPDVFGGHDCGGGRKKLG
jgi:hypothetical protein